QLDRMVVKAVDGAGGYGMLVGPVASKEERASFADTLRAHPSRYIAQPLVDFSTCPTNIP
ncbi:MAG: circularly permuted type 2 ATP-grasp protein, partial [Myxococcota bacterium]